ncbi:MAG: hypothetical protein AB1714_11650 [Acidobacteriota bacterium]
MAPQKYRQRGYMDSGRPKPAARRPRQPRSKTDPVIRVPEPRTARRLFRCASCGNSQALPDVLTPGEKCASCGADIHSCINCRFFDPSVRFECSQPLEEPIESKRVANMCKLFKPKITVDISIDSSSTPSDPRQAFDALFKKI